MTSRKSFTFPLLICVLAVIASELCYARAGGGGGGGHGGGGGGYGGGHGIYHNSSMSIKELLLVSSIPLGYCLFISIKLLVRVLVYIRNKKTNNILRQLSETDPLWDKQHLSLRVKNTYFMVQDAWRRRNPDLAKSYMSQRLYQHHLSLAYAMLRDKHRPVMSDIKLKSMAFIQAIDHLDNNQDSFKVHILGSMIDYVVDDNDNTIHSGNPENGSFTEIWVFIRKNDEWLLDEIIQKTRILDLLKMKNKITAAESY